MVQTKVGRKEGKKTRTVGFKTPKQMEDEAKKTEKKENDIRTFSGDNRKFKIHEVIYNPGITMNWTWTTAIDPVTKNRIEKNMIHTFYRVEILGDETVDIADLTTNDITILADCLDGRKMMVPLDKMNEVFQKSKKFTAMSV